MIGLRTILRRAFHSSLRQTWRMRHAVSTHCLYLYTLHTHAIGYLQTLLNIRLISLDFVTDRHFCGSVCDVIASKTPLIPVQDLVPIYTNRLVEVDIQWVARWIFGSHDSEFIERAPRAVTPLSDYFHPPCCLLNPWEMIRDLSYHDLLCSPHHEFCPVHYSLNSPGLFEWYL